MSSGVLPNAALSLLRMQVCSGNEQVILNVGGVKFTTTQLTLQNAPAPSLFAAMFSGRHTLKADQVNPTWSPHVANICSSLSTLCAHTQLLREVA